MLLKIKFAFFYLLYIEKYLLYKILYGNHAEEHLVEKVKYPRLALKILGISIGTNCRIREGLSLYNYTKGNLSIADNVHIGKNVLLDLSEKITIEENCTISMGSKLLTHQDLGDSSLAEDYPKQSSPLVVQNNSYLGANCVVLHTTEFIAQRTLLAANAMLNQNTEANSIYAGSPAVLKKNLSA